MRLIQWHEAWFILEKVEEVCNLVFQVRFPLFIVCLVALYDLVELLQKVDFVLAEHKGRMEAPLKIEVVGRIFKEQRVPERPHELLEDTEMLREKVVDVLS